MEKTMTIRPPEKTKKALKECAEQMGITVNALVTIILTEWLKQQ